MHPALLHRLKAVAGTLGVALLGGCASWLPSAHTDSSSFADFAAAQRAVEGLIPLAADAPSLRTAALTSTSTSTSTPAPVELAFDPLHHPNATLLTQADVVRMFFIPNTLMTRADLDPGVITCVEARGACHGIELKMAKIDKVRTGNFLKDITNFSRRTETTGWRFNAVILYVDQTVVYRAWGGQPSVNELEVTNNPLGPLQDISPSGLLKP
jgi:hypothetical protein